MSALKLNLKEDHAQVETKLGIIDIWQIEGGELFTVEIFPPNQSKESYEAGEFVTVWNVLEIATNMDFAELKHAPREWNWQQVCFMEQEAVTALFELLAGIENLEDFKNVKYNDRGMQIPVYESLRVIRNKYNSNYCSFCGKEINEDTRKEYTAGLFCCEECFKEYQNNLKLTDVQYNKNYDIGYEFLENQVISENRYFEIFEESENQGMGYKYGLTLVEYEDEDHTEEMWHTSIDLANLDMFIPKCTQCGSYITGDTCQNEDEEIICEECLINNIAKAKGLSND